MKEKYESLKKINEEVTWLLEATVVDVDATKALEAYFIEDHINTSISINPSFKREKRKYSSYTPISPWARLNF